MILKGPHMLLNHHNLMKNPWEIVKSKLLGNLMEPQGSMNDGQEGLPYEPLHENLSKTLREIMKS